MFEPIPSISFFKCLKFKIEIPACTDAVVFTIMLKSQPRSTTSLLFSKHCDRRSMSVDFNRSNYAFFNLEGKSQAQPGASSDESDVHIRHITENFVLMVFSKDKSPECFLPTTLGCLKPQLLTWLQSWAWNAGFKSMKISNFPLPRSHTRDFGRETWLPITLFYINQSYKRAKFDSHL